MKALVRNKDETVTENMNIEWIDWSTGAPLTNDAWCGGPYTLVRNYVPPVDEVIIDGPEPIPREEEVVEDDDYVVIGGVRYSKEELRSLIE